MDAQQPEPRETEQRRATVMFADVTGFTLLMEQVGEARAYLIIRECMALLDGIARRYGASVDHHQGDAIMAVFGVPKAVENAPRAAVNASIEMRREMARFNQRQTQARALDVHIGIETGLIISGETTGPLIREFHVLGDTVNTAARLKEKAPAGQIWVGGETWRSTCDVFDFELVGVLKVKGKQRQVQAFAVRSSQESVPEVRSNTRRTLSSELIGREEELTLLRAVLGSLVAGRGRILGVVGEPGIGKSRLVAEAMTSAEGRHATWLEGRCLSVGGNMRFHPFVDLFRSWFGLSGDEPDVTALEVALAEQVGDTATPEVVTSLATLLGLPLGAEEQRRIEATRGAALERMLHQAVAHVLTAAIARGPLVVAIDGLHWSDLSSLEMLEALLPLATEHPIGFVLMFRPHHEATSERIRRRCREHHAGHYEEISLVAALERGGAMDPRDPEPRETEQRRATVMFADITGFTSLVEQAGDARAYSIIRESMTLLDGIARRYGASVDHHQGDAIMAVFGVPKAVEDAPRAAINAGIEMRREVARFNQRQTLERPLDVHIGIETGPVISGETTGPLIREFHVVGDTVNTAARLKDKAPAGQIWVGGGTWRDMRDVFDFEPVGVLDVKGKQRQARAFAVRSSQENVYKARSGTRRTVSSELVGRDEELTLLRGVLGSLGAGRGQIVGIVGEPGIGKSRLVSEAMASAEGQHATWLEGRCLSVGGNLRFHPFVDLFRSWFGLSGDEPDPTALEVALAEQVGDAASPEVVTSLATLLGIPLDAEEQRRIEATRGDALERMLHQAVARVLAAARGPLVVAIDDLHWSDLSSLEMLEALLPLATEHPIGFVLMFRPHHEATSERIRRRCQEHHPGRYEEIALAALDEGETRTLLENFFRGSQLPRDTRDAIRERVAGNPFFAEEVVRSLIDEGGAELHDGVLVATERIHDVVIPGTVRDALMGRIDALPRARRQVLQTASVMGASFLVPVLEEVLDKSAADVLEKLEEASLIQPSAHSKDRWSFQHPVIQEVAYETIFEPVRPDLHRRVGEALERVLTQNAPGLQAMLAYHFGHAGDVAKSEEYLFRAGSEAARSAASNEALYFFQQAADLYVRLHGEGGDPAKRALLEKHVGIAFFNRGQLTESVQRFDRALVALGDHTGHEGVRLWLRFGIELLLVIPRLYWPPPLERLHPASEREREIIAIRTLRALGETLDPAFVFHTMSTLRMLLRLDPASVPSSGAIMAGADGIFTYAGISPRLGHRVLALADARVAAGHVGEMRLYHAFMHFIHHFLVGDWSPEHTIDEALIEEGMRLGQLWEVVTSLDMDCEWSLARGDFARAERRIEGLREIAERDANQLARVTALSLTAFLEIERGRLAEAEAQIGWYQDAVREPGLLLVAFATRARILCRAGRLGEAQSALEQARPARAEGGRLMPFHESFLAVARFELDVAQLAAASDSPGRRAVARDAKKSRARALVLAKKVAPRRPEVLRLAAQLDALLGQRTRALRGFEKALAVASALGARPEQARICLDLARFLEANGGTLEERDAGSYRAEAQRLRAEMGLSPEPSAG